MAKPMACSMAPVQLSLLLPFCMSATTTVQPLSPSSGSSSSSSVRSSRYWGFVQKVSASRWTKNGRRFHRETETCQKVSDSKHTQNKHKHDVLYELSNQKTAALTSPGKGRNRLWTRIVPDWTNTLSTITLFIFQTDQFSCTNYLLFLNISFY